MSAITPRVGMKIYDNVWYLRHGLEPEQAADILAGMGINYVLTQSKLLPMQDTAIESEVPAAERARFRRLDDLAFRRALAARGILYYHSILFGFDPSFLARHPDLTPIDQHGRPAEKVDWYIGIPSERRSNTAHKIGALETVVRHLEPDGVHLGFIRWPGFWEIWLDDVQRADMPDYCYAPATLSRFRAETGIDVPVHDARAAARLIAEQHKSAWSDWKCGVTVATVGDVRRALAAIKPDIRIAINTLPFFLTDFDNAVEEVFGQSPARLSAVSDLFEVMGYHQIMRRDASWPGAIAGDIKRRTGKTVVCTVQGSALYLDGIHAGRGRATTLDTDEFILAVDGIERSEADGICVFTFTDFLDMRGTTDGERRIARLKAFRR
ncbi:MAG TPA: hypothetical protein PK264_14470 [Hyphomicrobiaceae bacterium]|nr:hypothetical protein [Hyphomicrobiaceae bacterium]